MPDANVHPIDPARAAGAPAPLRVLVVEGRPGDAALVERRLAAAGRGASILAAADVPEALDHLLDDPADVILLGDPGATGRTGPTDALEQVRAVVLGVPVVVLADEAGDAAAVEAVRRGAQDVVPRAAEPSALARVLLLARERERVGGDLARRAMHDALTGLPNRVLLADRLAQAIGRLDRHDDTAVALLVLDLDGFKAVNDRFGHEAGDRLLVGVARRLEGVLRAGDTAARIGGDEFVILCEDVGGEHEAVAVAQRVIAALAEPFAAGADETHVRASVGIAIARGAAVHPESVLRDADAAMYRAKRGDGGYEVFDEQMRVRAARRLGLEDGLRRAIEHGEFTLHYQPVFRLTSGSISSCEALLRWADPARGLVAPGDFLDVAEEAGLTPAIGAWAIPAAARQAALWASAREPGGALVPVSANLSPRQCLSSDTVAVVADALTAAGAEPGALCLEFTEAAVMADLPRASAVLGGLRDLGVGLVIDDFGTAQSSLRLLEQLPVDSVKIDRSFTAGMAESEEEAAIVAAVIGLAHAFGLEAIAEGVETLAQVDRLRALGCDAAQGFYFARPQPPGELGGLLRALG